VTLSNFLCHWGSPRSPPITKIDKNYEYHQESDELIGSLPLGPCNPPELHGTTPRTSYEHSRVTRICFHCLFHTGLFLVLSWGNLQLWQLVRCQACLSTALSL